MLLAVEAPPARAHEQCGLEDPSVAEAAPPVPRKAREVVGLDTTLPVVRRVRGGALRSGTIGRGVAGGALSGKAVYVSAGHGWVWRTNGLGWRTQRGNTHDMVEDLISTETVTRYSGDNRSGRPLSLGDTFHSRDRSIVDQLNGRELFEKIIRCLPQREKRVFRLRYLYTLTMKEIADCVDISESRVSQILSQNTRYLRKVWSNRGDELWDEVGGVH